MVEKTGFGCPKCGKELLETKNNEVYCSNDDCSIDWTPDEIIYQFLTELKGCKEVE